MDRSKLVTVGGLTNGIDLSRTFFQRGGFPNRWCEGQWEPGLISQDLRRQNSREAHAFTVIVHQRAPGEFENCAKLLKTTVGEVPEWFNGSVCQTHLPCLQDFAG